MKKTLQTLWITLFLVFLAPAGAQENADDARIAQLLQQGTPGPQTIELGQQARLQLPAGMIYLSQIPANEFMNLIGNTMSTGRYGIVLPADSNEAWIIDLEYTQSGYIREDEANRLNPSQLLQNIRQSTEAENEARSKRGEPLLAVIGWLAEPHYDAASHRLHFALDIRQGGEAGVANYATLILGRYGLIKLDLITDTEKFTRNKPVADEIAAGVSFRRAQRYQDYDPKTDPAPKQGISSLIDGAVKNPGLLALLVILAVKYSKLLIAAAIAIAYGVKKFLDARHRKTS